MLRAQQLRDQSGEPRVRRHGQLRLEHLRMPARVTECTGTVDRGRERAHQLQGDSRPAVALGRRERLALANAALTAFADEFEVKCSTI